MNTAYGIENERAIESLSGLEEEEINILAFSFPFPFHFIIRILSLRSLSFLSLFSASGL